MKICVVSDLHGNLVLYPSEFWKGLEECELLLICGDILPLEIQTNMYESKRWLMEEFKPWAANLPVEQVYFVAGNHDFWFERNHKEALNIFSKHDKVTYLQNSLAEYISVRDSRVFRIFGTPYCHIFGNWAFMRGDDLLRIKYEEIPENLDILISHDSPKIDTIGTILQEYQFNTGVDAGNKILAEYILKKKPKYVFSGHIHSGQHEIVEYEGIKLANTSILNEKYQISYKPLIYEI